MTAVIRTSLLAAAMLALPVSAIAAEAVRPCLTPVEAQAMLTFILPEAFDGLADQCRATLPAAAVLSRSGRAMATRYRAEADAAWPMARVAFGKMIDPAMLKRLDDGTLKKLFSAGIASKLPSMVKVKDCAIVERFVAALEPLPARNMAMLVSALIEIGAKTDANGRKESPFNVCPVSPIASDVRPSLPATVAK